MACRVPAAAATHLPEFHNTRTHAHRYTHIHTHTHMHSDSMQTHQHLHERDKECDQPGTQTKLFLVCFHLKFVHVTDEVVSSIIFSQFLNTYCQKMLQGRKQAQKQHGRLRLAWRVCTLAYGLMLRHVRYE